MLTIFVNSLSKFCEVTRIIVITRIEIGETEVNGYYWDKVITPDGAKGYVARNYLRDSNGNIPNGVTKIDVSNEVNIKLDTIGDKNIVIMEPETNQQTIRYHLGDNTITKPDGTLVTDGSIGTGTLASKPSSIRPVININQNAKVKGKGTYTSPYIIVG